LFLLETWAVSSRFMDTSILKKCRGDIFQVFVFLGPLSRARISKVIPRQVRIRLLVTSVNLEILAMYS
jgi:hypothetical protein